MATRQWVRRGAIAGAWLAAGWMAHAATSVSMWVHAGPGPERDVYVASVKAFNESQKDVNVQLVSLPEGSYNDQIGAAALANKLPCILDFDGPNLYNYAWSGKLRPLNGLGIEKLVQSKTVLPTLQRQGMYQGKLYSVAQYDSGLAIWGKSKQLTDAGIRIPKGVDDAWTRAEFEDALSKLKARGVKVPLDMKFNYGIGEWISYGFAPIVQSFGADLIQRKTYRSAQGVLNSAEAVEALTMLQGWVKKGYVNPGTKNDGDFVQGTSALSWVGHWAHNDYRKALGDDLVLIPMPKLGREAVTGAGSWNFGITKNCPAPEAASKVLEFLMSKDQILRITAANGAVPATQEAQMDSPNYKTGGALSLYVEQSNKGIARVRPETPAYPVISAAFAEAVNNIVNGADVKKELDKAVKKIDTDIEDNNGYQPAR